jgi:amidase
MARTVGDCALMLSAMAGPDPRAPISLAEPGSVFARPLQRDFRGVKIAWSPDLGGLPVDRRVAEALATAPRLLGDLGATVEQVQPDLRGADEVFRVLRAWHFELSFGALLRTHREQMKDTVIWNIEEGARLSGPEVGHAEAERTRLFHRVREFMEQYEFLAAPVVQVPPFDVSQPYVTEIDGQKLHTYLDWMRSCYWISATGLPAISVPCGFTPDGLPVGLQLIGRHHDDFGVLQLAYAFEQRNPLWQRRPPAAIR